MRSAASKASNDAVLVFDVDAAGVKREAAWARCDVRLVALGRPALPLLVNGAAGSRPSAVLVLRALTAPRLEACVRAVHGSSGSMSPEHLCQMLAPPRASGWPEAELTGRELSVLRLLADGDSTRDIAERLSYSERTVKNIVRNVLAKVNGRTRAHAVALAARRGMI